MKCNGLAPRGRNTIARCNAPGEHANICQALKGRNSYSAILPRWGLLDLMAYSQGVALGSFMLPRWG